MRENVVGGSRAAILLASYNRVRQTLACLQSLRQCHWPSGVSYSVFLVDDGSTDGTPEAVAQLYPEVVLLRGSGRLFWCNSMRLAWQRAAAGHYDFYLWLNDDTALYSNALVTLFSTWEEVSDSGKRPVIVVGSCRDPVTGQHAYGGYRRVGRHPARLEQVFPSAVPEECDTFNGNIVLVPRDVHSRIGNMRPFAHSLGDTDYGLRARAAGCSVFVAPGYLGECRHNDLAEQFVQLPLRLRIANVFGPKIFPPASWFRFYWYHSGLWVFIYWPISLLNWLIPIRRRRSSRKPIQ